MSDRQRHSVMSIDWSEYDPGEFYGELISGLVDTWSGRSIGGCTYHVVHPGGRSYERFPVNAVEAESRRENRFQDFGHTPSHPPLPQQFVVLREFFPSQHPPRPMAPPPEELLDECPSTLDLRR